MEKWTIETVMLFYRLLGIQRFIRTWKELQVHLFLLTVFSANFSHFHLQIVQNAWFQFFGYLGCELVEISWVALSVMSNLIFICCTVFLFIADVAWSWRFHQKCNNPSIFVMIHHVKLVTWSWRLRQFWTCNDPCKNVMIHHDVMIHHAKM